MSAKEKLEEVIRMFYYEHHDSNQFRTDLLALVESEKIDFLTKLINHVDTRISYNATLAHHLDQLGDEQVTPIVEELTGMRDYLKRQRGDQNDPPPSVL